MTKPVLLINEMDRIVTTIFEDGAKLHAAPSMDDESKARAAALGYTHAAMDEQWVANAVWCMTKDHERLHHLVAEAEGKDHSTALWYAAHPNRMTSSADRAIMDREERIVLLIQRLLNQGLDDAVS